MTLVMVEKACAYVIPKPDQTFTFEEMSTFLLEKQMAKFKIPERLEIVDSYPMSGDGQKIIKGELTRMATEKLKAEGKLS